MKKYSLIIFDLDGTLLNTKPGIFSAIRYTADKMNLPQLPESTLAKFCGPPSMVSYKKYFNLDDEMLQNCIAIHRKFQNEQGYKEAAPYKQIENLLKQLKTSGYLLAVATLKREDIAVRTLDAAGLSSYFDLIKGIDLAESKSKKDLLEEILDHLHCHPTDAVLIGDSQYDAQGAWTANIPFIAVTYGYGFKCKSDTDFYHPVYTAKDVYELCNFFTS